MDTIQQNAFVVLDYILKDSDGDIVDRSDEAEGEPIRYVHGYGMLVPGLEARLPGLKSGESKEIQVPAAEAFGDYDDELVLQVDRGELPDPKAVAVGDELVAESPEGEEAVMHVLEVHDDYVVVDANHPLAGVDLTYSITVRELRAATEEEIEKAVRELEEDEAGHVHGPECGHDPQLVNLGSKLSN